MTTSRAESSRSGKGLAADISVVDLAGSLAGQFACRILADLGAEVFKIEWGQDGDPLRQAGVEDQGLQHLFTYMNAGKKSVHLTCGADDVKLVERLCALADVVVVSGSVCAPAAGILHYAALREANPGLIYCVMTPFGLTGPDSELDASDATLQALSGGLYVTGDPTGYPALTGGGYGHTIAGVYAASAIGQALIHRANTGRGQQIDVSQLECLMAADCAITPQVAAARGQFQPPRIGPVHIIDTITCLRGPERFLMFEVWGSGSRSHWARLANAIGRPELIDDPRFVDDEGRRANIVELVGILEQWLKGFDSSDAAVAALLDARVLVAPLLNPWEIVSHPQFQARGMVCEVRQPDGRTVATIATPPRLLNDPITVGPVPALGEHNREAFARAATDANVSFHPERTESAGVAPLEGVTVIDLSAMIAGAYATRFLAAAGARVIKIEQPPDGDMIRTYEGGGIFAYTSSGKEGVGIDIQAPEGQELVRRLIADADVLMENFTPGVMERLGLDWESVRTINPRLIYCSVSGFGQYGPWRDVRSTDPIQQALSGISYQLSEPDSPANLQATGICDPCPAAYAALASTFALLRRRTTDTGERIDLAMFDADASLDCFGVPAAAASAGRYLALASGQMSHLGHDGVFRAGDGHVVISFPGTGRVGMWGRLTRLLGDPGLADDERFVAGKARKANAKELTSLIESWLNAQPDVPSALAALAQAGVLAAPVLTPWQALTRAQTKYREFVLEVPYPNGQSLATIALPAKLSETPSSTKRFPKVGEHTYTVLRSRLDLGQAELDRLASSGVIYQASVD